jgi:hypothetical protein
MYHTRPGFGNLIQQVSFSNERKKCFPFGKQALIQAILAGISRMPGR